MKMICEHLAGKVLKANYTEATLIIAEISLGMASQRF